MRNIRVKSVIKGVSGSGSYRVIVLDWVGLVDRILLAFIILGL